MICSLNEIEAYSRRAARGAGMPWGLAEEAGYATRWLAARGLPAAELLTKLLIANDGRAYQNMAPIIEGAQWHAQQAPLCPLCCGSALSDRFDELVQNQGRPIVLCAVACPLLLVPFTQPLPVHHGEQQQPTTAGIVLSWPGVRVLVSRDRFSAEFRGDRTALSITTHEVTISPTTDSQQAVTPSEANDGAHAQVTVDDFTWQTLNALAHRTYVPASEASRELGAG